MYTMGREREKAHLERNPYYQHTKAISLAIIDAYHDWHDGLCSPSTCLDRVFQSLGPAAAKTALETAGYWFRRAVGKEPAFIAYVRRLGAHKAALARVYSVWELPEPEDWGLTLVSTLSNDRSRRVRRAVLNCAMMGRWLSVVPILREAHAMRRDDPQEFERAISLITTGYYEEADGSLCHYVGGGPGGADGLGGTEAERAKEALEIFSRLSGEELEYRRRHGQWPNRPPPGFDLLASLRGWSPLRSA